MASTAGYAIGVGEMSQRPRIGASECLLGRTVRFDGGHKRLDFLTDALAPHVDIVPVCPEVEIGMGVPRESVRLVAGPDRVDMVGNQTGTVWTERMETWAAKRADELAGLDLDGYVLKKDSPSCGLERVRLHRDDAPPLRTGTGLFAAALRRRLPSLPVTEDGWLHDARRAESFLARVFTHHRLRAGLAAAPAVATLVELHAAHKFLYMAHAPGEAQKLGRVVAAAAERPLAEVAADYTAQAMHVLSIPTSPGKHVNVLQHILGFFKDVISADDKAELLVLIDDYRTGVHGLATPLAVLVHHLRRHDVHDWLAGQVYLEPYPRAILPR